MSRRMSIFDSCLWLFAALLRESGKREREREKAICWPPKNNSRINECYNLHLLVIHVIRMRSEHYSWERLLTALFLSSCTASQSDATNARWYAIVFIAGNWSEAKKRQRATTEWNRRNREDTPTFKSLSRHAAQFISSFQSPSLDANGQRSVHDGRKCALVTVIEMHSISSLHMLCHALDE